MSKDKSETVVKPLGSRLVELMQSLQILRDSIASVRAGKAYQMIPIYGQLRALLTERSKKAKPLLTEIAEMVNQELQMYAMPTPDEDPLPDGLSKGLIEHLAGFPVTLHQTLERQKLVNLPAFLEKQFYLKNDEMHSAGHVIDLFANKAGGAHYARRLTKADAALLYSSPFGTSALHSAILQLAEVTLALGTRLLRRLSKFDFHIVLFAPLQKIERPRFILDCKYPENPARFALTFQPGMKLGFHAKGIDGVQARLIAEKTVTWPGTHYLWISTDLNDDLQTSLRITIDGEESAAITLPFPLFIPNTLADADVFWNRSHEDATAGATVGVSEVAAFGGEQSALQQANLLIYFEKSREKATKFVFYKPGTSGNAPPGVRDVKMTEGVVMRTIDSINKEYGLGGK